MLENFFSCQDLGGADIVTGFSRKKMLERKKRKREGEAKEKKEEIEVAGREIGR